MKKPDHLTAISRALLSIVSLALGVMHVMAQTPNPPGQLSYQGFLTDANGIPLATNSPQNYTLVFRIYNAPIGGTPLWGELQTVTLDRGYFSVMLGQGSAVSGANFTNDLSSFFVGSDASDRYIGVTVNGLSGGNNVEIQPRMRLLASPYSFLAGTANNAVKLAGYDWSTLFPDTGNPSTGTFPGAKLAAGSITGTQIAAGAVGSTQIANGAVGSTQLANGAVGAAQIANQSVGNAQLAPGSVDGTILGLPLFVSGSDGTSLFFLGSPPALVSITNTAVSSIGLPFRFFAGYGLKVGGENAVEVYSQSGNAAYLGIPSYAGEFVGNVYVNGTLSKSAGSFKIDHPLDPAHKYLSHSFVESPDMKNIYDGVVTLDASGAAVVELPNWFEALNQDFRYQLTAMGAPQPNLYVAEEISGNHFKIAGGVPGAKASWQVTGVRHDPYANAHRIPVEESKPKALQGTYIDPVDYHQPAEKSEQLARHSGAMAEGQPQSR